MTKLVLNKDTLAELTTDELGYVNGAAAQLTPSCPLVLKVRELLSEAGAC